jgi:hypothetical protein
MQRSWYLSGLLGGLVVFGGCGVSWGYLAAQYTLTPLEGQVTAIAKDDGRVIGEISEGGCEGGGCPQAQLYPTVIRLDLESDQNTDVYDTRAGYIVGRAQFTDGLNAFLYTASSLTYLGLGSGLCVTSDGDVWGESQLQPVVWRSGGNLSVLPTLGGSGGSVNACSERGDGAGTSLTSDGAYHCTYWPGATGVSDCHPGNGTTRSHAADMNYSAQIAANAVQFGHTYGYLWLFHTILWLMPLPGDVESVVLGLNDKSDAVGRSCPTVDPLRAEGCRAVGWEAGRDPVELLPRVANAAGWTFTNAVGIDNAGRIAVRGTLNGVDHSALLTPVETPVTAYFQWRWIIYDYYARQYWRWIRAGGR